jgi:DtxR family Mn-dependent transcriptional regulator
MNTSFTEENYLKTIFKLSEQTSGNVSTNAIAEALQTKASSVTDMIKNWAKKTCWSTPVIKVFL